MAQKCSLWPCKASRYITQLQLKIFIKYMVSTRCKMAVKEILRKLGVHFIVVDLGEVEIMETLTAKQREHLALALHKSGLELMDDKKSILIERIKNVITEMVHYSNELPRVNNSDYISEKLHYDYTYLSNVFSEVKGITIQQYIIIHKIERAKELILYDELNLTEIAFRLNYSSVAHLSNQFKKITGVSPSYYKQMKIKRMVAIDEIAEEIKPEIHPKT